MKIDIDKLTAEERRELAKQARRINQRIWQRANPDKVKQYNERYWAKKAITMIRKRDVSEDIPYFYMLSTDGFSNSYKSEADFHVCCRDYFNLIQEHGFEAVASNLKDWLKETSELGCGDDITVVMAYYDQTEVAEDE